MIAVRHSLHRTMRKIGETYTNIFSFSFKIFFATNPFVQFHSHAASNSGRNVWVIYLLIIYKIKK